MKMFALHIMLNHKLDEIKMFESFHDATVIRDQIIMELRDDWNLEEDDVEVMDNGNANIALGDNLTCEIKIKEVEN